MYRGLIIPGRRHKDCYKLLEDLKVDKPDEPGRDSQGFLTSENRYVDRKEGWKIADAAGQIKFGRVSSDMGEDSELISENLFLE